MNEIGALRRRGYSEAEISRKIGVTSSWVSMIVTLLERGEERLLAAVETGLIPISLAMEISRAESEEAQGLLLDAYETGKLRGKKLASVRRILEMRMRSNRKSMPAGKLGRKATNRKLTASDLMQVYQREAEKQRLLVKKSDFTQTRLLFIVEAIKDLLGDDGFVTLLRAEGLETMPRALAMRIAGEIDD
jgi:ParB family chromosome partitioning protein